ncbi:MAG: winged helix-turn-helix transcriptional regulator [Lachnospiraceae bacterium]|nr:winged helix-turn-helix transcriptional regulator [Lachnospiraceae bacterium]
MDTCDIKLCREFKQINNLICRQSLNAGLNQDIDKMTLSHGWVIGYLYDNRNRVVLQRELEKEFNLRRSTVTTILQTMEKNGLVERLSIKDDARQRQLVLTPKAELIHKLISKDMKALDERITEGIDKENMEIFYRVLLKIKGNLEESKL